MGRLQLHGEANDAGAATRCGTNRLRSRGRQLFDHPITERPPPFTVCDHTTMSTMQLQSLRCQASIVLPTKDYLFLAQLSQFGLQPPRCVKTRRPGDCSVTRPPRKEGD